jgi:hypothetical protein
LALRLGGQLRAVPTAILGWDFGAALAMARALGVNPVVAAEVLPEIEAIAIRQMNDRLKIGVQSDG